jgi:hypothetical protein
MSHDVAVDMVRAELADMTRKNTLLCNQNGALLIENHDLKKKVAELEAEIAGAKHALGDFAGPTFGGTLAGGIDALSLRCASAEKQERATPLLIECEEILDATATFSMTTEMMYCRYCRNSLEPSMALDHAPTCIISRLRKAASINSPEVNKP